MLMEEVTDERIQGLLTNMMLRDDGAFCNNTIMRFLVGSDCATGNMEYVGMVWSSAVGINTTFYGR